jgi:cytidylate kinase
VARRLGLRFLDTGAMYRAVALKARRLGLADPREIASMIRGTRLSLEADRVLCDGRDMTREIRGPEVASLVRPIADSAECRAELVRMQRDFGRDVGLVTEGRDQGSVVFPDADFKFYLDASVEVRARRRQRDEGGALEAVRAAMERRDAEDRARPVGPLVRPEGAVEIDTSALTVEEVVARMVGSIGSR